MSQEAGKIMFNHEAWGLPDLPYLGTLKLFSSGLKGCCTFEKIYHKIIND